MATVSPDLISSVIPFSISSSPPAMGTRFWRFSTVIMLRQFLFRILRQRLALGLLLLGFAQSSAATGQSVLVLGDSISAAYGMSLEQGWVALLADQLEASHPDTVIVNASISGETSGGGLRRLPQLLEQHQPRIVIIELGGNDGLRGYPVNRFRDNLREMAQLSQQAQQGAMQAQAQL